MMVYIPTMKRISVKSSTLKSVGYDLKNKRLEIEFLTFEVYQYKNVSPEHYITLMNPPEKSSHGIFFSSHIRDRYDYRNCPNKDWIKAIQAVKPISES